MRLRTLNVGCFGGGTGLPSLLGGLKSNPWLNVHAVVTMFDSGGSSGQLRDELANYTDAGVRVLAVSTDPVFSLKAFKAQEGYDFPLLADFWPHGEVARAYGVFHQAGGMATRGTFLVDTEGVIRWTLVNPPGENRDFADYRLALEKLRRAA